MEYNFDIAVEKMHAKEVQSFHNELAEQNEAYYEKARSAGYDNLHDYEANVTSKLIKRLFITACVVVVLIVGYIIY